MRVLVWGTGTMSSALAVGFNSQDVQFYLHNPTTSKAESLALKLNKAELWRGQEFDAVVLGFKPQKMPEAASELSRFLKPDTLILSLLAGVKLDRLRDVFSPRVIRLMPNLAIAQNNGVCLWTSTLEGKENTLWQSRLNALGFAPQVEERELDLYTLHAGCAPAFLYFLIQEMKEFAHASGGDPVLATKILTSSLQGALDGLRGDEDFQSLISQVASKGGVTESTLRAWKESGAFALGLQTGLERIKQLS